MNAPEGYVLTKHEGYFLNRKHRRVDDPEGVEMLPDGLVGVAWFDEKEPFINTGNGWSPNAQVLPIVDGWVPPVWTLHTIEEAPNE